MTRLVRPLFAGTPIGKALEEQRGKLAAAVDGWSDEALVLANLDALVAELSDIYRIAPLTLDWGAAATETRAVPRRVGDTERLSTPVTEADTPLTYVEVSIAVPFEGAPGLFDYLTPESTVPALGFVRGKALRLTALAVDLASALADLERQEEAVAAQVAAVDREVGAFNEALPREVRQALAARLALLAADRKLADALTVPRAPRAGPGGATKARGAARAARDSAIDPPRPRGRPPWTAEKFQTSWRKALAATPGSPTNERLAPNFKALDGHRGVSPDYLRRLRRRFRYLAE
jgi:hypothetical protein